MANNYWDMTGTLTCSKVTPVLRALFDQFSLESDDRGTVIGVEAESSTADFPEWQDSLDDLLAQLGLPLPDELLEGGDRLTQQLDRLAEHFGTAASPAYTALRDSLVDDLSQESYVSLDAMFNLALLLDDGHGLSAMSTEGAWTCSKHRLFEFGGSGTYASVLVRSASTSTAARENGALLNAALVANNLEEAARLLGEQVDQVLEQVQDLPVRAALRGMLATQLLRSK